MKQDAPYNKDLRNHVPKSISWGSEDEDEDEEARGADNKVQFRLPHEPERMRQSKESPLMMAESALKTYPSPKRANQKVKVGDKDINSFFHFNRVY